MATSGVKLLGAGQSPFVNRVVMVLEIKSIDYELIEMNRHKKPEILIKSNPVHKKIPVLIHGDRPICESLIIVQYIDDAWTNGPTILPSDPYDCATARFSAAFVDENVHFSSSLFSFPQSTPNHSFKENLTQLKWFQLVPLLGKIWEAADALVFEKTFEAFLLLEEAFISCSKGKAFFGGDNVGYLDIALRSFVGPIRVAEMMNGTKILDETKTPRLVRWAERLYSDSLVKDVMLDPQELLEAHKKIQAMSKASSDSKD